MKLLKEELDLNTLDYLVHRKIPLNDIGDYGNLYLHNGELIKLDVDVCKYIMNCYGVISKDTLFKITNVSMKQIELLCKKQEYIKLTALPKGVILYEGIPIGSILSKYFKNYYNLCVYYCHTSQEEVIEITKNLLLILKELEDNDICQDDLYMRNILYSHGDLQMIDMEGPRIIESGVTSLEFRLMYTRYLNIVMTLIKEHVNKYDNRLVDIHCLSYEDGKKLVKEVKRILR